jgi:antitoxin component YwqK of YwqJK toxin-antitoxin module
MYKKMKYIFVIAIYAIIFYFCISRNGKAENAINEVHAAVLLVEPINLPNQRIVEVIKQKDYSKDFKMIPYCFEKNEIIDDTLIVQFYTQNLTYPDNDRKDTFSFDNGVLKFSDAYIYDDIVDSIVTIDKETGEGTVSYIYTTGHVSVNFDYGSWQSSQKRTYKFVGFKEVPSVIQFWGDTLCECPTKPIKFEIYKNDTINILNENGRKDGVWLEFYDNGIIKKRQEFNNGENLGGYLYDKTGKATHQIHASIPEIAMPIEY